MSIRPSSAISAMRTASYPPGNGESAGSSLVRDSGTQSSGSIPDRIWVQICINAAEKYRAVNAASSKLPSWDVLMAKKEDGKGHIVAGIHIGSKVDALKVVRGKHSWRIDQIIALVSSSFYQNADGWGDHNVFQIDFNEGLFGFVQSVGLQSSGPREQDFGPFYEIFKKIDETILKGRAVLVHCMNGECRSVSLVIAYLMNRYNKEFDEVYKWMQVRHPKMNLQMFLDRKE